jgi:hypothetical protein
MGRRPAQSDAAAEPARRQLQARERIDDHDVRIDDRAHVADHHSCATVHDQRTRSLTQRRDVGARDAALDDELDGRDGGLLGASQWMSPFSWSVEKTPGTPRTNRRAGRRAMSFGPATGLSHEASE